MIRTRAIVVVSLAAGALWTGAGGLASASFTPLAKSPELWATVDVCDTPRQPNTIGIRGSMPSDGHPHDTMYMRFQVQLLAAATRQWTAVGKTADSGFVPVGSGASPRQGGHTFGFQPATSPYTMRGLVEFQWRRAGHVVHLASRTTVAGHVSLAGAEPKGYSAATCTLK
jgi:hypothetical protein